MGSFQYGMLVEQIATTATSGSPVALTNTSKQCQYFTGSTAQTVKLPPTTNMSVGQFFNIFNGASAVITMQYQDGSNFSASPIVSPGSSLTVTLVSTGSTNGTWAIGTSGSASTGGSKNYLSTYVASTSSNTPNAGNGSFETGSTADWSLASVTLSSANPTTISNAGSALVSGQYIFTITSGNATVGATYTNNGHFFTNKNTYSTASLSGTGLVRNCFVQAE